MWTRSLGFSPFHPRLWNLRSGGFTASRKAYLRNLSLSHQPWAPQMVALKLSEGSFEKKSLTRRPTWTSTSGDLWRKTLQSSLKPRDGLSEGWFRSNSETNLLEVTSAGAPRGWTRFKVDAAAVLPVLHFCFHTRIPAAPASLRCDWFAVDHLVCYDWLMVNICGQSATWLFVLANY